MASKDGSTFFFTSESVNEGHPDKLADQVGDDRTRLALFRFFAGLDHFFPSFSQVARHRTSRLRPAFELFFDAGQVTARPGSPHIEAC